MSQLSDCPLDAATLDSEGRCVILEFPAFVLIGVYCPANRDDTRDEFRLGFLNALDSRVRNLIASGKRVFLAGDLNIIREEFDTANAEEQLKKQGITGEQYVSTPARRILNQLLVGGKIFGSADEGREKQVMWDLCRSFHPMRRGMFTCWQQKINARPGNFGSRIDYVLCSDGWKNWFCDSNIQEGLMGSDHCPVYAVLRSRVDNHGNEMDIRDIMSSDMFKDGVRQREWSTKDLLPMSAKLIPEFDRRRSIRDMFTKKPSLPMEESSLISENVTENSKEDALEIASSSKTEMPSPTNFEGLGTVQITEVPLDTPVLSSMASPAKPDSKRPKDTSSTSRPTKRSKTGSNAKSASMARGQYLKGQSSLKGFFKPKTPQNSDRTNIQPPKHDAESDSGSTIATEPHTPAPSITESEPTISFSDLGEKITPTKKFSPADQKNVVDPIVAKESWSKLLGKRVVPRCEHNEPCISMVTKKAGVNCGRSFYMCPRPLGPSGQKEKNTQWRCGTFVWSSDWTGDST